MQIGRGRSLVCSGSQWLGGRLVPAFQAWAVRVRRARGRGLSCAAVGCDWMKRVLAAVVQGGVREQKACLRRDRRVNDEQFTHTVWQWKDPLT